MPEDDFDEFEDEEIPEHVLAGVAQVPRTLSCGRVAEDKPANPAPSSNEFDEFGDLDDDLPEAVLDMVEPAHKRAKTEVQNQISASVSASDVPEKACPKECGAGTLAVKTSQSSRNPNRRYYSCSNEACKYFEWFDPAPDNALAAASLVPSKVFF